MTVVYLVLWIFAVVFFLLAAFNVPARVNLIALGLAAGALVFLIQTIDAVA
jgi:hypothetical protein